VVLPGFRADAASACAAFDVFLMPSRYEGFGLALAEAMAHGVPAVVSPSDSLPELIRGYAAGAVVRFSADNVPAVSRAIVEAAGQPRIPTFPFPLEAMVDGYLECYRRVMGDGR
jgi:glycosyltransferase involved in cell wall biosynthesis